MAKGGPSVREIDRSPLHCIRACYAELGTAERYYAIAALYVEAYREFSGCMTPGNWRGRETIFVQSKPVHRSLSFQFIVT